MPPSDHHRQERTPRRALAAVTGAAGLVALAMLASIAGLLPSFALAGRSDSGRSASAVDLEALQAASATADATGATDPAVAPDATNPDPNAGGVPAVELATRPAPTGVAPNRMLTPSVPVEVRLPTIGVSSSLEHLARQPDGSIAAPVDFDLAGWFDAGPQPGQPGPAVIAGHVDSYTGPAVFFRLRDLQPGDPIEVRREDGSVVTFRVTRTEQHPKVQFPSEAVYGPVPGAELRLITCGGQFDRSSGHYRDNLVVFAVAT